MPSVSQEATTESSDPNDPDVAPPRVAAEAPAIPATAPPVRSTMAKRLPARVITVWLRFISSPVWFGGDDEGDAAASAAGLPLRERYDDVRRRATGRVSGDGQASGAQPP